MIAKSDMTSYTIVLLIGCRSHPVFHCDLILHSTSFWSLKLRQDDIEGDVEEYAIIDIGDVETET